MTEEQKPSSAEPKQGVFSSIQGARSKDPDAKETPAQESQEAVTEKPVQPSQPEVAGGEPQGDTSLSKALRRVAQLERQINQIGPWAQFGMTVGNDPKGKNIVERYQRGEALFITEDDNQAIQDVEDQRAQRGEPPLTRQELAEFMDQREAARNLANEINSMAEERLPEFRKISKNQKFAEMLDWARQSVWRGNTPLDDSVADMDNDYAAKEMTAVIKAYKMYVADNPKVRDAIEKASKKQKADRAAEAAGVPSSMGQTSSSQEEPAEKTEEEDLIDRMVNVRGRGKSFASIGSKSR